MQEEYFYESFLRPEKVVNHSPERVLIHVHFCSNPMNGAAEAGCTHFNVPVEPLGVLLKGRLGFTRPGPGLRACIPNKLPGDAWRAGPCTRLAITRSELLLLEETLKSPALTPP